jgi:rhodanese-related sulfurtransferase
MWLRTGAAILLFSGFLFSSFAQAEEGKGRATAPGEYKVRLTADKDYIDVMHHGRKVRVQRIQDTSHLISKGWAKTSRKCPPFCIQPTSPAPGVTTVGEFEIFHFMEKEVADGVGLIVDARTPSWYKRGTIPTAINVPFTTFSKKPNDPKLVSALKKFGGRQTEKGWDFRHAKSLLLFCNGPWCGQSPRAIRGLLKLGFPAKKLFYYRGGMQNWNLLGLTTVKY